MSLIYWPGTGNVQRGPEKWCVQRLESASKLVATLKWCSCAQSEHLGWHAADSEVWQACYLASARRTRKDFRAMSVHHMTRGGPADSSRNPRKAVAPILLQRTQAPTEPFCTSFMRFRQFVEAYTALLFNRSNGRRSLQAHMQIIYLITIQEVSCQKGPLPCAYIVSSDIPATQFELAYNFSQCSELLREPPPTRTIK
jgi:hypothetical protein